MLTNYLPCRYGTKSKVSDYILNQHFTFLIQSSTNNFIISENFSDFASRVKELFAIFFAR